MKHATLMYTCMGLMATSAIIGSIDYATASKAGTLKNLYKEEVIAVDLFNKKIELEDYSRGPLEYDKNVNSAIETDTSIQPPKVIKKDIPPPPPPKKKVSAVPGTEAVNEANSVSAEAKEVKEKVIEEAPVTEIKQERLLERFSRAPLPKVRKRSKNNN